MKATVEISGDLLNRARRVARKEGSTLRALIEEGLRLALNTRAKRVAAEFRFPVYGEGGRTDAFRDATWDPIREEIYRDRG